MGENKLLESAIWYSEHMGFSVIPILKGDKKPLVKWEEYQKRKATKQELVKWWHDNPDANIGIVTGKISNLSVIDIDTDEGKQAISEYIPDSTECPVVGTPRGGQHLYFTMPEVEVRNNARTITGCDFRGEGGYVVAPPSTNGNGKPYKWVIKPNDVAMPPLPVSYLNIINNYIYKNHVSSYNGNSGLLIEGNRDNELFKIGMALADGRYPIPKIEQVLEKLAETASPPFPKDEIPIKIKSIVGRLERKERNLKHDFQEWISLQTGYWNLTEAKNSLQLLTKEEKNHLDVLAHRFKNDGIIERYGTKAGCYRKVENKYDVMDFMAAPTDEFKVSLPCGVSDMVKLYPGNVVIVAGTSNAGKTAYLLNIVKENMAKRKIYYLNSEMGETELRTRLELFEDVRLKDWKFTPIERSSDFADLITDEDAIFIIDYVDVVDDFWKVAGTIKDVHEKLKKGIAIIALQKKSGTDIARGGEGTLEKARLYLTLDRDEDSNIVKIVKGKAFKNPQINPNGRTRRYSLVMGSKIIPKGNWA